MLTCGKDRHHYAISEILGDLLILNEQVIGVPVRPRSSKINSYIQIQSTLTKFVSVTAFLVQWNTTLSDANMWNRRIRKLNKRSKLTFTSQDNRGSLHYVVLTFYFLVIVRRKPNIDNKPRGKKH